MTTCAFPPHHASLASTKQYLGELRDKRLKQAGVTVEQRIAFTADRIRLIHGEK